MKKKIVALITFFTFFATTAHASILGSLQIHSDKINVGKGLDLYNNVAMILQYHTSIRHIRGGDATRRKFMEKNANL